MIGETTHGMSAPRRNPEFTVAGTGKGIALARHGGAPMILNQSAGLVWGLCDGERTVADIVRLLAEAYPEAAVDLPGDVARIVRELHLQGVLDLSPERTGDRG